MLPQDQSSSVTAYKYLKCTKPLDFSNRSINSLEELNGNQKPLTPGVRGEPKKDQQSKRYKTGSLLLNNNALKNINGLRNLTNRLVEMPEFITWLDLSNNNLNRISDELLLFPNLTMLYLHGNGVEDVVEVYKLRVLRGLRSLTLHRNPMCSDPCYRNAVACHLLPHVRKLDNLVVLPSERDSRRRPLTKELLARLADAYPEDFGGCSAKRRRSSASYS